MAAGQVSFKDQRKVGQPWRIIQLDVADEGGIGQENPRGTTREPDCQPAEQDES